MKQSMHIDVGMQVAFKYVIEKKNKVFFHFCFCFAWGGGVFGHNHHLYDEESFRSFNNVKNKTDHIVGTVLKYYRNRFKIDIRKTQMHY